MLTGKRAVSLPHPQSLEQHNYVAHKAPRGAKHPGKCSPRTKKKITFQRPALAGMAVPVRSELVYSVLWPGRGSGL